MSDVDNDGEIQLSQVLWDLHFATTCIVNGVVNGVYCLPTEDVIRLEYATSPIKQERRRRYKSKKASVKRGHKVAVANPALLQSATFQ